MEDKVNRSILGVNIKHFREKKGFSASIRKVAGSVPYRVQVGIYRTKKAANKVVKKLKTAGFTVLVKNL